MAQTQGSPQDQPRRQEADSKNGGARRRVARASGRRLVSLAKFDKPLSSLAAIASIVSAILAAAVFWPDPEPTKRVEGTVLCGRGLPSPVVGVFIRSDEEDNKFAEWTTPDSSNPRLARYSLPIKATATRYSVRVGCGGTPEEWMLNANGSTDNTGYKDWVCVRRAPDQEPVCT